MVSTQEEMERAYLQLVYGELEEAQKSCSALLDNAKQEGHSTLKSMNGEVGLNFDSLTDNLDTFAALEMKNREIDQLNIRAESAETELKKIRRLLERPYFGKITADFMEGEGAEDFYIGISGFANDEGNNRIYDWRSPVSELFYSNDLGPAHYQVAQQEIPADIRNRRQFIIEGNRLHRFFDTSVAMQDDILLEALASDSTRRMRDITATIQKEQNVIIRDKAHPVILVNGVAGSGKTSAIMQRIAYLLYSLRQEITADNILILSPNDRFIRYISDVLPSLGEKNPLNMTMSQLILQCLGVEMETEEAYFARISKPADEQTKVLRSSAFASFIAEADHLLAERTLDFKDISLKGKVILSKETIDKLYQNVPKHGRFQDRMQALKASLKSYWQQRIIRQARSKETQDQILAFTEAQQQKYFHELIQDDSKESLFRYGKRLLEKKYRSIGRAIQQNSWLDEAGMFDQLYEAYSGKKYQHQSQEVTLDEAVVQTLIRHLLAEKIPVPKLRFLLIDEVQDYTEAQLFLLLQMFPKTAYTLVGDENQAIFNSYIDFSGIEDIFQKNRHTVKRYNLQNSYRSSGAITKVFRSLLADQKEISIVPIRPDGMAPVFFGYQTKSDYFSWLENLCRKLQGKKLTIITKTMAEAEELNEALEKETELIGKKLAEVHPISLSKGLEFDSILVHNASEENYHTEQDRRILYTAVSRGMQRLYVSYREEISAFLEGAVVCGSEMETGAFRG